MQFYPADWRKDPNVQSMGFFERGVWFEILCLMFESEQRGKLVLNGKPMPDEALARLLGLDKQRLISVLTVLIEYGVASRDDQGALVNRRMVRDEELRQVRAKCGSLGGNPALLGLDKQNGSKTKKDLKQSANQTPTPSSSLSSSTSLIGLIDACVREHPDLDSRLVETAVLETMDKRSRSPSSGSRIRSVKYFDEEIAKMVADTAKAGMSSSLIDIRLKRRRQQAGILEDA